MYCVQQQYSTTFSLCPLQQWEWMSSFRKESLFIGNVFNWEQEKELWKIGFLLKT